jgi:hypothetical protein
VSRAEAGRRLPPKNRVLPERFLQKKTPGERFRRGIGRRSRPFADNPASRQPESNLMPNIDGTAWRNPANGNAV